MARRGSRGLSSSSSTSTNSGGVDEHIIRIPHLDLDLEAGLLIQLTEEHHPNQQIQQLPHSSPRRRVHSNSSVDPEIPVPITLPPDFTDHHRYGFRVRRFFRVPRNKWSFILHALPAVVLFCFFLLWWFSLPVTLAIKDGRIIDHSAVRPVSLNDTEVGLDRITILAVSHSPDPNIQLLMSVIDKAGDGASPLSSSN